MVFRHHEAEKLHYFILLKFFLFFIGVIIFTFHITHPSFAAEKLPDLTVSPYSRELTFNKGSIQPLTFTLRNNTQVPLQVNISYVNFQAPNDKSGTPEYFLNRDNHDPSFFPSSWFLGPSTVQLPPKGYHVVNVTLNVPSNASPGGHYGGVEFESLRGTPSDPGTGVIVTGKIGVPIIMTVNGNIVDQLIISKFTTLPDVLNIISLLHSTACPNSTDCHPLFDLEFINQGNIHESPVGYIDIYNMFNAKVLTIPFNTSRTLVLPNSTRGYEISFDLSKFSGLKLGSYTAKLSIVYGGKNIYLAAESSFMILNWAYLIIMIFFLLVLIAYIYERKNSKRRIRNRIR